VTTFKIFTRGTGVYLTNNLILWPIILSGMLLLSIRVLLLENQGFTLFDNALLIISVGAFLVGIGLKLGGFFEYRPLKGNLDKTLILESNQVSIGSNSYNLADIKKIEIRNDDYKGSYYHSSKYDFNGSLSNGVDNNFTMILNDGQSVTVNFVQNIKFEIKSAQEQLISYHSRGKLHFLNLIEVLGITDYEEIQEFKKSINQKKVHSEW
jgi:hypothetical protein